MAVTEMIGNVPVIQISEGVRVINICRLMDALFGPESWRVPYKETTAAVMKWVQENNASYYADCKEDFFIHRGVWKAQEEGKDIVVVENLS